MGTGYTWDSIDNISYLDYIYLMTCMNYESKAMEIQSKGGQRVVS